MLSSSFRASAVPGILSGMLTVALVALAVAPSATAHDLDDRRDDITEQIEQGEASLDQSSSRLERAVQDLQGARTSLASARTTLARTRGELSAAQALDARMRSELRAAVREVRRARAELARGQERMAHQEEMLGRIVVRNYATGDPALMALSMVLNSQDTAQLTSQLNSVRSVLDKEAATLDRLEATQVLLSMQESRVAEARGVVARKRAAAAENLERQVALEAQAAAAEADIEKLVVARSRARARASEARTQDLAHLQDLEQERERVSLLLQQRAEEARRRAEAAARRAAAQKAAQKAAQEAAQEAARRQAARARRPGRSAEDRSPAKPPSRVAPKPDVPAAPRALLTPVAGYITSSYGMRFHPVYKRWSLHDGTDWGAACGTPIRAAAAGTVVAVYSHSAYGKRVIMDNGYQRGVGLGTSYNHLSSYSTHVGQRVSRGEVIGYVGTTGASTGCHLHFMVFENGQTVDPMTWL